MKRCRRWAFPQSTSPTATAFRDAGGPGAALAAAGGAGPGAGSPLRSALATSMFGLTALDIENLKQDEQAWDALVEEFSEYRQIWRQRGVMPMLRALMTARHIAENLLATRGGERRLTDILHIGELLQEAAGQLESEHPWCAGWRGVSPSRTATPPASRCVSKAISASCEIVTIHKSKGLEYPAFWLPFIAQVS